MKKIQNYLPDVLIDFGFLIFSYYMLIPPTEYPLGLPKLPKLFGGVELDYHVNEKLFGLILLAVGLNIVIRRCVARKNNTE